MNYTIGLDSGGTSIKALAVTPDGRVLAQTTMPTGDTGKRGWRLNVRRATDELQGRLDHPPAWISLTAPARRVWLQSVRALAVGIVSIVNVLDPEVVVIGGGITRAKAARLRPLNRFLIEIEWRPGGRKVRVARAKLGEHAGASGAAWNAIQVEPSTQ